MASTISADSGSSGGGSAGGGGEGGTGTARRRRSRRGRRSRGGKKGEEAAPPPGGEAPAADSGSPGGGSGSAGAGGARKGEAPRKRRRRRRGGGSREEGSVAAPDSGSGGEAAGRSADPGGDGSPKAPAPPAEAPARGSGGASAGGTGSGSANGAPGGRVRSRRRRPSKARVTAPASEAPPPSRPAPAPEAPAPSAGSGGPPRREREFIPMDRLRACQDAIGYHFRDVEYLRNALTHSSVKSENHPSNERLEFLGDSVLGHIVAEYVYQLLPDYDEGEMTKVKSVVVSTQGLATVAGKIGLDKYLAVGRGISMRGQIPQSLMANVFEAVVAAVYLDRGFECARLYILDHLTAPIEECLQNRHQKNYKSILQQIAQRDLNSTPVYKVLREEGPEHRKDFEVVAVVGGYEFEPAWGPTKKEAEQRAARAAVMALTQKLGGKTA